MKTTAPRLASADDAAALGAAAADDSGVLNDVIRADLVTPRADSATWLVPGGLAHVQHDTHRPHSWLLGVTAERATWGALLERVHDHVAPRGGGTITWWCAAASDDDIAAAVSHGYTVARQQHELRVPLPLDVTASANARAEGDSDVRLRTLQPGDVGGVLAVNNAAFAGHPEQGGWTRATLDERMAQPWFDASLFVVADASDPHGAGGGARRIVGFNWLKPHAESTGDVARGEIYAIAVDPGEHGRGLGRRLAVHGLDLLHARGFNWASLFVAADNDAAIALYRSLGFVTYRTDAAFVTTVSAR